MGQSAYGAELHSSGYDSPRLHHNPIGNKFAGVMPAGQLMARMTGSLGGAVLSPGR